MAKKVLITGGAGFVGGNLAVALAGRGWEVVALDNLHRRGSELNLPRLRRRASVRARRRARAATTCSTLGPVDALVECSAEPSVMAGVGGAPDYVVQTNLMGAYHCLELARRDDAQVVFLSTSRVYPCAGARRARLTPRPRRASSWTEDPAGIAEDFPLAGARTLYGATKLAAELLHRGVRARLRPARPWSTAAA